MDDKIEQYWGHLISIVRNELRLLKLKSYTLICIYLRMREKFKKLTDEVNSLVIKLTPIPPRQELFLVKLENINSKINAMAALLNEFIPQLETQIKDKDRSMKKIKKTLKETQDKLFDLQAKTTKPTKFVDSPLKVSKPSCQEQERYKFKYEKTREQLTAKKEELSSMQLRVKVLEDKTYDLIQQNKHQSFVIEDLLMQFGDHYISEESQMTPRSSLMMEEDEESSTNKQTDEIETDDQLDEMVQYSDQESNKMEQQTPEGWVDCVRESEECVELKECKMMSDMERSWYHKILWFLY